MAHDRTVNPHRLELLDFYATAGTSEPANHHSLALIATSVTAAADGGQAAGPGAGETARKRVRDATRAEDAPVQSC